MLVAIETSDLVGSTKLSEDQNAAILSGLKYLFSALNNNQHGRAEFYRGDGFQVMYTSPQLAIKYLLLTKLYLRSQLPFVVELTQSLAVGELEQSQGPLSEKMAEVFIQSGRQLDSQAKGEIAVHPSPLGEDFVLATDFLNRIVQQLTTKQADAVYWYIKLDFPDQQTVADKLKMTRQNIATHLQRANADLIRAYINRFSKKIQERTQ
jgi:predicted DNA-binding protein YlxM (UPF0122 family)